MGTGTERRGGFIVAGVARHSAEIDVPELWATFDEHADDLATEATDEDRYGVAFDLDPSTEAFTYVAGKRVASTDDLPPEMTAVEVPEAVYTVFTPAGDSVNTVVEAVKNREFRDEGTVNGPMFERYGPDEDPADPETALELYVPVEEY